eukprot:gnl/MRDRNA2_/MRDRNA2_60413_c0_seq2.p1 gnl/MRDRNA2_/MRDRNA2_60413_c0~~gnl/MRDRNA2_/MRDRNA2_60413_c0_seq2.p1  ORF type:complete len:137 (-),score=37.34 gnl/MRDRNA2_/MRDRNA2_60413_c0_seq2:103-513(-)
MQSFFRIAIAFVSVVAASKPAQKKLALTSSSAGAPAGAPGAAPGPAASPAAPKDNWGADTHAEEFGKEYTHHVREGLKEPHVGEAGWQSETHANVANFDPHGRDFVTDSRSPAKMVFSGAKELSCFGAIALAFMVW